MRLVAAITRTSTVAFGPIGADALNLAGLDDVLIRPRKRGAVDLRFTPRSEADMGYRRRGGEGECQSSGDRDGNCGNPRTKIDTGADSMRDPAHHDARISSPRHAELRFENEPRDRLTPVADGHPIRPPGSGRAWASPSGRIRESSRTPKQEISVQRAEALSSTAHPGSLVNQRSPRLP